MPEEAKKPLPIIPLLPGHRNKLNGINLAINNSLLQRNILLETILECNGVTDTSTYELNKEGTALTPIADLRDAHPFAQAGLIPKEAPVQASQPDPFATSPMKPAVGLGTSETQAAVLERSRPQENDSEKTLDLAERPN